MLVSHRQSSPAPNRDRSVGQLIAGQRNEGHWQLASLGVPSYIEYSTVLTVLVTSQMRKHNGRWNHLDFLLVRNATLSPRVQLRFNHGTILASLSSVDNRQSSSHANMASVQPLIRHARREGNKQVVPAQLVKLALTLWQTFPPFWASSRS